ncbi:MAG: hypothetical protein ABI793_05420 [Flavobacterium sp.]
MKKLIVIIILTIGTFGYGQNKLNKKWYSNLDLELIMHKKVEYSYSYFNTNLNERGSSTENLNGKKAAFGLTYSFNYMVFKKLSLGVLTGYKSYKSPDLAMLELGGIVKYFFVNTNNVFTYVSLTSEISLNKNQFNSGTNARIGIGVPIVREDKFNININLFKEQNFLRLNGADPLFGYNQEKPSGLIYNSWGLSAGIKF